MTEDQAYTPGAEHPVGDIADPGKAGMDGPLPLPRKNDNTEAWMDKHGCIYVHNAEQAAVFETEKAQKSQVIRSPMYGNDETAVQY